ncbi:hypothetical protein BY996DRAFT_6411149 [Phakopsora pachyrhizi]|nr:hypothetical protein BY996DRAFT_6411149 [Phakopsora pachyrhizi]
MPSTSENSSVMIVTLQAPLQDHSSSTPEKLWATPLSKGQRLVASHPLETGLLRSEWAEVDCGWVKALDQQSDSRLDGSDHSSIDPWVNGTLDISDPGLSLYYHVDYQKVCHVSCCHRLEDSTSHPDSVRIQSLVVSQGDYYKGYFG